MATTIRGADARHRTWPTATLTHLPGVSAATVFVVLCTLLPFLPGRHDSLAVPLSVMAQALGAAGIVLVPVGVLWLVAGRSRRLAGKQHVLAFVTLLATSLAWGVAALGALVQSGLALCLLALGLFGYVAWKAWPVLRRPGYARGAGKALAVYQVALPVLVALCQLGLVGPALEFSRSRAIRNSAPLITAIEQYRATLGHYPPSLLAVHKDYSPGVVGIAEYRYEPSGDAYNLVFEQFRPYPLGTREFVVYNPRDEHAITSHAMDRLLLDPARLELEQRRGASCRSRHATSALEVLLVRLTGSRARS